VTTIGLLASWAAALFAGWAFVGGLSAVSRGRVAHLSARRALLAATVSAAAATASLLGLLLTGDVTVSYVARSISTNLPSPYRVAALWALPSGAVLPTAVVAGIATLWTTRSRLSPLGVAAGAGVVVALLASSLAADPFATLPWTPADGLGLASSLRHPWSAIGGAGLSLAMGAAARLMVVAADGLGDGRSRPEPRLGDFSAPLLSLALLGAAAWSAGVGGFLAGGPHPPIPPAAWGAGAIAPFVTAVLACRAWAERSSPEARLATALGLSGVTGAFLLRSVDTSAGGGSALTVLVVLSLGTSAAGAAMATQQTPSWVMRWLSHAGILLLVAASGSGIWLAGGGLRWMPTLAQWLLVTGGAALVVATGARAGGGWPPLLLLAGGAGVGATVGIWLAPGTSPSVGWGVLAGLAASAIVLATTSPLEPTRTRRWSIAMSLLALALASVAAAGEERARPLSLNIASGGQASVALVLGAPIAIAHQGVSRYQDETSHVLAIAVEPSRAGRPLPLASVEQREFIDARDEPLGPAVFRPAVIHAGLEAVRVRLTGIDRGEGARLEVTAVPFEIGWALAVVSLVVSSVLALVSPVTRAPLAGSSTPELE